jgi:octaprenyl-diphosphate synthase
LPLIYTLQNGSAADQQLIRHAITHKNRNALPQIMEAVHRSRALDKTRDKATQEKDKAIEAIATIPESNYKQALISLAQFSVDRSF